MIISRAVEPSGRTLARNGTYPRVIVGVPRREADEAEARAKITQHFRNYEYAARVVAMHASRDPARMFQALDLEAAKQRVGEHANADSYAAAAVEQDLAHIATIDATTAYYRRHRALKWLSPALAPHADRLAAAYEATHAGVTVLDTEIATLAPAGAA